jgi:deoxycytidine triphosphate deaminase
MFINPKTAIENGWITGIQDAETQIQPNAIDFTLDTLFGVNESNPFVISEGGKQMRGGFKMEPILDRSSQLDVWHIEKGSYDGMSNVYVDLPEGVAAMTVIRSTFNRNGIFLTSGLYDSGYKGHIGFMLHNTCSGLTKIATGTRVGQLMLVSSDSAKMYEGGWNHEQGSHYTEEK